MSFNIILIPLILSCDKFVNDILAIRVLARCKKLHEIQSSRLAARRGVCERLCKTEARAHGGGRRAGVSPLVLSALARRRRSFSHQTTTFEKCLSIGRRRPSNGFANLAHSSNYEVTRRQRIPPQRTFIFKSKIYPPSFIN